MLRNSPTRILERISLGKNFLKKEVHPNSTRGEQWLTPWFSIKTLPQRQNPIPTDLSIGGWCLTAVSLRRHRPQPQGTVPSTIILIPRGRLTANPGWWEGTTWPPASACNDSEGPSCQEHSWAGESPASATTYLADLVIIQQSCWFHG